MCEDKILYQIKTLEKMVARNFISDTSYIPTPTQMQIMDYIIEHIDSDIYQKDLEEILSLRRATVSGVLQTMEKNELIQRITVPTDTRTKKIILNKKAKEIFIENKKKMCKIEKAVTQGISKEDLDTFSKVIDIMKNNIENMCV